MYFSALMQAKVVSAAVASRQDSTIGSTQWSNNYVTLCIIAVTLPNVNQFIIFERLTFMADTGNLQQIETHLKNVVCVTPKT